MVIYYHTGTLQPTNVIEAKQRQGRNIPIEFSTFRI